MNPRVKKFFSYYRPYKWLFAADIACAMVVSAITLILPLCAGYITRHVLETNNPDALTEVYRIGALMLVLVAVHMLCLFFIDY
ncbi:MAG: ABC transporter ATP-binding protein, partial [Chloroflexota bacterium]